MKVMAWLAEHNFPYGLVTFGNGISKDLQRHKTEFLRYLVNDVSNLLVYKARSRRRFERWVYCDCPPTPREHGWSEIKLSTAFKANLSRFIFHASARESTRVTGSARESAKIRWESPRAHESHTRVRATRELWATRKREFEILSTDAWQEFTENEFGDIIVNNKYKT